MPLFALEYRFSPDPERRLAVRPRHRAYLEDLARSGVVRAAGPFGDDDGALIIYSLEDEEALEHILADDPYVQEDVFATRSVREWRPFITSSLAVG
ncbi:MAG TPA: YciI family protein [Gaiellaceae bacterium]|nr:YciI family protein [Gaiellaceae bacterium]